MATLIIICFYSRERKCNFILLTTNGNCMTAECPTHLRRPPMQCAVVVRTLRNSVLTASYVTIAFLRQEDTEQRFRSG
jgi:hypothetical protein